MAVVIRFGFPEGALNLLFGSFFAQNCMKMKEVSTPPLPTVQMYQQFCKFRQLESLMAVGYIWMLKNIFFSNIIWKMKEISSPPPPPIWICHWSSCNQQLCKFRQLESLLAVGYIWMLKNIFFQTFYLENEGN